MNAIRSRRVPSRWTLLLACAAMLGTLPALAGYHEERLDNGLRVILIEHRANPMVNSAVIVGAGVVHEPAGMNGASHFLEHLLFNGTETRTQRELYDEVDRYGAYNNATTREDHTLFTLLIQREFAERGLEIQADMLLHSTLPPDKFEKEKGIVLEELARDKTDPAYLADRAHREFAYAGTPLARSVLGTEESIAGMKRDDVWAYYKTRYVPENMSLVVMGDFDASAMMAVVKRIFGAAEKGKRPPASSGSWPEAPERNLLRHALDAGRTYVHAAFPLGLSPHDPLMPAVELLIEAVSSGQGAPLSRELTSGENPAALSFSLGVAHRRVPWSTLEFEAILPPGRDATPVLDRVQNELRRLSPGTPAWDRVASFRSAARTEEVLLSDKIHYYAMMRSAYLVDPPPGYLTSRAELLEAVRDEDLERAAAALRRSLAGARVVVSGPDVEPGRAAWKPATEPLESIQGALRTASETLSSGLQLFFERNDDSQVFALHLMFRPRSASEPDGKPGIADFLHRMFLKGSLVRDAAALDAAFTSMGATVKTHDSPWIPYDDYYTTPAFSFVRVEMPADRWRDGLAMLGEMVLHPRLAAADVEAVRTEMLDLLSRRAESSRSVAGDLLARALAPGHALAAPVLGTSESVGSITPEDLRAFHRGYVTGRHMILTGTGPVGATEVLDAAGDVFGAVEPGPELLRQEPPPLTEPGLEATAELGKEQAYLALGYTFDADPKDRAALTVAAALLSDDLSFHLREERGLAYSMGAYVRPFGGRTTLNVVMGTRPANVDEALEGIRQGIAAFRSSEVTETQVRGTANAIRGRLLMRRMTRVNLAYFAGLEMMEGRPPGDARRRLDELLTVKTADVQRVIRTYLDPERCAVVVVR